MFVPNYGSIYNILRLRETDFPSQVKILCFDQNFTLPSVSMYIYGSLTRIDPCLITNESSHGVNAKIISIFELQNFFKPKVSR